MSRRALVALTAALVLLTACASQKPQHASGPAQANASRAPVKTHGKPARQGDSRASPGAPDKQGVSAGEVGYFLDVLQGRLQQQLAAGVIIARESSGIVLDFSRRFGFFAATAQVDDAGRSLLMPLAKILDEYRAARVSVFVSAEDDTLDARKLAEARANAVIRVLTDAGIARARAAARVADTTRDDDIHVEIVLTPETRAD